VQPVGRGKDGERRGEERGRAVGGAADGILGWEGDCVWAMKKVGREGGKRLIGVDHVVGWLAERLAEEHVRQSCLVAIPTGWLD